MAEGIRIKNATEVTELVGTESVPISNDSNEARRATVANLRGYSFNQPTNGIMFKIGSDTYIINGATKVTKPATPTISCGSAVPSESFTRANGSTKVTATCSTSGVIFYYAVTSSTDGTEPATPDAASITTSSTSGELTLQQDTDYEYKWYKVVAKAYKNGAFSDASNIVNVKIYRKLAAPTITPNAGADGDYGAKTTTISGAGTTTYYSYDNTNWTEYTEALNIDSTKTVYAKTTQTGWVDGTSQKSITANKNKCYIGQAASIGSVADIKNLAHSYKADTLVGQTPTIDFGSTLNYVWFCIPSTAAKTLKVKGNTYKVTLDSDAGTVVGDTYRVWSTESRIYGSYEFEFE